MHFSKRTKFNWCTCFLVTSDKPGNHDINESGMGLIGTNSSLAEFNQQIVKLGQVGKDREFLEDVERALTKQVE